MIAKHRNRGWLTFAGYLLFAVALVMLFGCGEDNRRFYGGDQQAWNVDSLNCEAMTRMSFPYGFGMSVYGQLEAQAFFTRCMATKGWTYR